ncbi:hypothetical protein [Nocardioides sp. R-C-SC26]|uniref:hypothetical protein n=1 Tax=Nocardioides sp. R-C-SC26 TaxID=2870414 RepID=UPI001E55E172|nr:hypothetical protein [Nocardioides sp. R-C-SC26]
MGCVRRIGGVVGVATATSLAVALLSGCSTASEPSPPTGIDELTIPTPDPAPSDFVPQVDNPWLALDTAPGPEVVGVPTTLFSHDGVVDFVAQDRAGNVWWFGREGEWQVGQVGQVGAEPIEAGLLIAAHPRQGDGYLTVGNLGVLEPRATVVDVDEERVELAVVTPDGSTLTQVYLRDEGLQP